MNDLDSWLASQLNVKQVDINLGLSSVGKIATTLNLFTIPQKIITVSGTNGKGSTVAILNQLLNCAGLKTGVFTSPHFVDYTERIKINQTPISETELCQYFSTIKNNLNDITITYFEYGVLAAMLAFVHHKVDVIILEVGLGGRLDATNAWDCDVAILTNVDLDHQEFLGDTKEQIGHEKAGIFRKNIPAIVGENPPQSVLNYAKKIGANLQEAQFFHHQNHWDLTFKNTKFTHLALPSLSGKFQLNNASCAIQAANHLIGKKLNKSLINKALSSVSLIGRLQTINHKDHEVLLDVAHNPQAINALKNHLNTQKITAIFGVMRHKDIDEIIKIINPLVNRWIIFDLPDDRALSTKKLLTKLLKSSISVTIKKDCKSSFELASKNNDLICVFGSFITVTEFLKLTYA